MTTDLDAAEGEVEEQPCANHAETLTAVACGKCGTFICPRCMVFTPVGIRCRDCAQLRRPAQFDVTAERMALAALAGLVTSFVAWYIALQAYFFIWLLAIFVGLAVGEVASRLAKRRDNIWLEVLVGADIVLGFFAFEFLNPLGGVFYRPDLATLGAVTVGAFQFSLIPLALAIIAGVTRLRQ